MEPLTVNAGQQLLWEPSNIARRAYELRDGEQVVATTVQLSFWRPDRTLTTATNRWILNWIGMTKSRLVISDPEGATVAQVASAGWKNSATLTLGTGETYTWRSNGFWGVSWSWADQSGQVVATLTPGGVWRRRCTVTVGPASVAPPMLALLAAAGWALIQIRTTQTAAVGAAAASAH